MFWTQPIIPENFRYLKRGNLPFFQCTVRAERRLRSDTGYFIAYQMLEARDIARDHYTNRYQKIPSWWGQFEVCQGFWAELGPVLTYYGRYLSNPRHGLWVVFLTEWCVKVASTLLWETYDSWRLWFLPPKRIELMRLLDYTVLLGCGYGQRGAIAAQQSRKRELRRRSSSKFLPCRTRYVDDSVCPC